MAGAWRKVKIALGLRLDLCLHVPRTMDDASPSSDDATGRISDAVMSSPASAASGTRRSRPMTPTTSSASGLRLSKSGSGRSSKRTCPICLGAMKAGQGHALFTAECSHAFHFHCIASSVKHGNQACPVCRARWKDVPFPAPELPHGRSRISPLDLPWPHEEGRMTIWRPLPRSASTGRRHHHHHHPPSSLPAEPGVFDDDESLDPPLVHSQELRPRRSSSVEMTTCPEFPAVPRAAASENFTVLIHLKAPVAGAGRDGDPSPASSSSSRAPVDLVTVLDVSGSMAGTKLALLKRAMGFVIQHLGPSDRLSVVAFSSTARRLFPLRRMSEAGGQQALHAVNSLVASGGTNIADALRKGLKVIDDRKHKNPVCSLILLSDGQDTYTLSSFSSSTASQPAAAPLPPPPPPPDYRALLPRSSRQAVPVHAFGFGSDHDAALMHAVSDLSGGTYSFIEAEGVIQDAFAQCIGGLLSVVVQEMRVDLECLPAGARIVSIKSGGYAGQIDDGSGRRRGSIAVGDLYADEERDFLVSVAIPALKREEEDNDDDEEEKEEETAVLMVSCSYRDAVGKEETRRRISGEVRVRRPEKVGEQVAAVEVDRQRNRLRAAETMAEVRAAAERGQLEEAAAALERCRRAVAESAAGRAGDGLSAALEAELREMQERTASRQRYEASGRAFVLSGLSSHSWQRATARGDSTTATTDGGEGDGSQLRDFYYQTPSMVDMLQRSQTLTLPRRPPAIRPVRSFPARPSPR